ncbi:hypothetical protein EHQ12_16895 [Leptospira gomenensis]|uniref:Uncharacterized protein n=1 Tax=Leptospira gomenensis TaxID=2484974 RepID=A0A5F1YXW2_9LEPT|nr:hypothetical protein EHQ17_16135 [Leptospira gomenensis]TGK33897.1 hypothetical protein EHQ12_16895 [Leptospira gomenensis]TGK44839.1 hypothetical protein EHQ07_11155 [Leptospira gomenensis]TGK64458.1 hypothetical protein EHQ13_07235 [Leptospira gomenensis]
MQRRILRIGSWKTFSSLALRSVLFHPLKKKILYTRICMRILNLFTNCGEERNELASKNFGGLGNFDRFFFNFDLFDYVSSGPSATG